MKNPSLNLERRFLAELLPKITKGKKSHFQVPPGDDAAILKNPQGLVLSIDGITEDVHFKKEWKNTIKGVSLGQGLGWKAMGSALSDLAAMGDVQNRWALIFFGTPDLSDHKFIWDLQKGIQEKADRHNCLIAGGDTIRSRVLTLAVAVGGTLRSKRPLTRKGIELGDFLCIAGTVGDAAVGLKLLKKQMSLPAKDAAYFIKCFFDHRPLLEEGRHLAQVEGVRAVIDLSDSLHESILILLGSKRMGVDIDMERIPTSSVYRKRFKPNSLLLENGEDYAMLFVVAPRSVSALRRKLDFSILAQVREGILGPHYYLNEKPFPSPRVFAHF